MSKKTFKKDKKGHSEEWEWEETTELQEALARLHKDMKTRIEEAKNDS